MKKVLQFNLTNHKKRNSRLKKEKKLLKKDYKKTSYLLVK
jgi:hypothetical protein